MENNNNECASCNHEMNHKGCCGHGHHHVMKWIIKLIVLVLIFCFAFEMGELKGMLNSEGYGSYRMMNRGGYYYGGPMMYGYGNESWDNQAVTPDNLDNSVNTAVPAPTTPKPTK